MDFTEGYYYDLLNSVYDNIDIILNNYPSIKNNNLNNYYNEDDHKLGYAKTVCSLLLLEFMIINT